MAFEKIVNYSRNQASLSDFKGKTIILDYWATWCGPCIKSLPHLAELQEKFGDQLQVLTITDDSEERINQFLTKQTLKLPVAIDERRKLASVFPHRSIPHTVVIDNKGIVKAIATSSEITEEVVKKAISGGEIDLKEKKDVMDFDPSQPLSGNSNFLYQITITPFQEGFPSFSNPNGGESVYQNRRIIATNLAARTLFEIAYQFPVSIRTIMEVKEPDKFKWSKKNAICFDLIVPEELAQQRFEIMKQHLTNYFGLKAEIQERNRPVKVLKLINAKDKVSLKQSSGNTETFASYGGRGLKMENSPIGTLASFLESQLDIPVVDETKLKGKYDLEIPWYNENPEQIHEELKKKGLELVASERKIKVLVIKDK